MKKIAPAPEQSAKPAGRVRQKNVAAILAAAEALGDWPALELSPDDVEGVRHGHRVKATEDVVIGSRVRGVSTQGELVALMEAVEGEEGKPAWQPKKVFFTSE